MEFQKKSTISDNKNLRGMFKELNVKVRCDARTWGNVPKAALDATENYIVKSVCENSL